MQMYQVEVFGNEAVPRHRRLIAAEWIFRRFGKVGWTRMYARDDCFLGRNLTFAETQEIRDAIMRSEHGESVRVHVRYD